MTTIEHLQAAADELERYMRATAHYTTVSTIKRRQRDIATIRAMIVRLST